MKRGKKICETLKGIRQEIATANEIDYSPAKCDHEGDCAGTCPCCESEMRWLESQLRLRRLLGKAVTIAGLSLGLASLASCTLSHNKEVLEGEVENVDTVTQNDDEHPRVMGLIPLRDTTPRERALASQLEAPNDCPQN